VSGEELLGLAGRISVLVFGAGALLLNVLGLPGNWILLALAVAYALITGLSPVGWGTLGVMTGLALVAEGLELGVGLAYTAKRGATRRGTLGAFVGGLVGAVAAGGLAPPLGALAGAFGGTFLGAYVFEYLGERRRDAALRAGRAAFVGRIVAAAVKTMCGFWMWVVLAWRLLFAR
jgi:uncharacterized protein YqgC (DUF456 family)